jgi:ankyrin repeat protein
MSKKINSAPNTAICWLPGVWAVSDMDKVNMEDLRYLINRESILPQHEGICKRSVGHVLACYNNSQATQLLRQFPQICRQKDRYKQLPLHTAAVYCNNLDFIHALLKFYPSAMLSRDYQGMLPIHRFCNTRCVGIVADSDAGGDDVSWAVLKCLINAEPYSLTVVDDDDRLSVDYALNNEDLSVDICLYLLELCPASARIMHRDGALPIHRIFSSNRPEDEKKVLMEKLIELYPESVSIPDDIGNWPAHMAASWNCQQCCIRLLGLNSEALQKPSVDYKGNRLDVSVLGLDILVFSMKTFPDHFTQILDDGDGHQWTPLHSAVRPLTITVFAACTTRILMQFPAACRLKLNGNLPLHRLLFCQRPHNHVGIDYLSSLARCVRLLVQLYPESVAVKNLVEKSPYDICVQNNHDLSIQRILLRAYPQVDYQRYCDLNYEARRMALFLSLMAFSFDRRPNIFRQLFCSNRDLLAHVCSFL